VEGVKDWVRQLVLLVLLATCLELLLPMNSMKKYVRLTMSLLVVLAVTRPILALLGQPIAVDYSLFAPAPDKPLPSLNEILAQASEFRAKNQTLATQQARAALEVEAVRAAKAVPGVADAKATVDVGEVDGQQQVQRVRVTVVTGRPGAVLPVEPVRPVQSVGGKGPAPSAAAVSRELTEADKALLDAVRREVGARLGVTADPGLVQVLVEPQVQTPRR
jgi:stage III sporulation protein AF